MPLWHKATGFLASFCASQITRLSARVRADQDAPCAVDHSGAGDEGGAALIPLLALSPWPQTGLPARPSLRVPASLLCLPARRRAKGGARGTGGAKGEGRRGGGAKDGEPESHRRKGRPRPGQAARPESDVRAPFWGVPRHGARSLPSLVGHFGGDVLRRQKRREPMAGAQGVATLPPRCAVGRLDSSLYSALRCRARLSAARSLRRQAWLARHWLPCRLLSRPAAAPRRSPARKCPSNGLHSVILNGK